MSAGPYSLSGKKWCGYAHYVGTLERAKAKRKPRMCGPVKSGYCPSPDYGETNCNTWKPKNSSYGCSGGGGR